MFAVSSDDNSDFWLSTDESPLNVQLLAWVGKVCTSVTEVTKEHCAPSLKFLFLKFLLCHIISFACDLNFPRVAQSGQPQVNTKNMPVRPPDQFGELRSNYILLSDDQAAPTVLRD